MQASTGNNSHGELDSAIVVECENGLFVFASGRGPGAKRWFFPKDAVVKCTFGKGPRPSGSLSP